ncbi:outer membrane protein assembly factor BamB family protein [Halapricum desulfuricans]|uniref:WD40/PQQ-like beta propeller repeat containing protein n=1 Tax=Halapricum desulfuricans TaxID=2841257 RepID=A0A897MZJ0_9EURY|nr:PQQ-binding-like beta-propeller repeat protein [Halapricum desulfuricans]QSG07500.1 WD40/PQQ-like beta propeller repeat containing protein [Halapricum desulfuricans]
MPYDRRTVLSALAGGGVAASVGTVPALGSTPGAGKDATVDALSQLDGGETPATLEGSVTTAPVSAGDRLLVGTDRGCYVFENQEVTAFVSTRPVRRISPLGDDRAVLLVEDQFFPNVLAIDLASGEVEWRAARTRTIFSQEFGEIDRQVPVFDAVEAGGNVAVATGYGVVGFDIESGEEVWTVDRDYYTWRVRALDGTVYATTQDGKLLAIDGESGDRQYVTGLAEPFESGGRSIPRSAWDLRPIEGGPADLVVTTEDGYVKGVRADDGSVKWDTQVHEPDSDELESYYRRIGNRPTMAGGSDRAADGNFCNLEVTPIDGDRIAISIHERGQYAPDQNPGQVALVTAEGETEWTNESINLAGASNVWFVSEFDSERLLVPSAPDGDTQTVTKLGLANGQVGAELTIPAAPPGSVRASADGQGYLADYGGNLVVASESGDLQVIEEGTEVVWSFTAIQDGTVLEADFTGDGVEDYLIYSRNQLDRQRGVESRSLVVRSGANSSIVWSRTLGAEQFHREGGLQNLQVIDGDDGVDLLGIEQRPGQGNDEQITQIEREIENLERDIRNLEREQRNNDVDNSDKIQSKQSEIQSLLAELDELGGRPTAELVALTGTDGSERARIPLEVESSRTLPDLIEPVSINTLDEEDNVVFIGGHSGVAFVNLRDEAVTDFWRYRPDESDLWPPIENSQRVRYVSVGGSGEYEDMLAISADNRVSFAVIETGSETENGDKYITFEKTTMFESDGERIVSGSIRTIADLDGDGYREVLCLVQKEDTQTWVVVSPGDGAVIGRFESEGRVTPTVREIPSPDGGNGLVTCTSDGDRFTVSVTDGVEETWRHQEDLSRRGGFGEAYRPADLAGEVDGTEAVALATTAPEGGAKVDLYGLSGGDRLKRIVLEPFETVDPDDEPLAPATRVQRLPAADGEEPNIGVIADPTGEGDARLYVVDPREGEVLISGDAADGSFVELDSEVGILASDAGLRTVDATAGVTLDASGGPDVTLSWEFDDGSDRVTRVTVGEQPVAITTDRSTTVRLPPGEHTVSVAATSPDGFTVYDSTTPSVTGSSMADTLLYAAAGASVLGLFGMPIVNAVRRRVQR